MAIFSHVAVGTNDLEKARGFYDNTLGVFGIGRVLNFDDRSMWGIGAPEFAVIKPIDGKPASRANGGTIGFTASTPELVDKFHAAALSAGGVCDGAPGPRPMVPGLYAAYVRDPDGNKLCAIHFNPAG